MSASDLISLRYQPPICAPVLPIGKLTMLYALVELAHQLHAVAFVHPGGHLARVQAERNRAVQREGRVLAEEVVRRGVGALDRALLHASTTANGGVISPPACELIWNLPPVASDTFLANTSAAP